MKIRILLIFLFAGVSFGFSTDLSVWSKIGQGIYEADIRSMMIDPMNDEHIYVGTSKALYRSTDKGRNYQTILRPSGEQKGVNDIYITNDQLKIIYAATDSGLYESTNDGATWNRIYYSPDKSSRQCLSIARHDDTIYVGTHKGLFRKADQKTNWHKVEEGLDDRSVYQIVQDEDFLYFVTSRTLFGLDKQLYTIKKLLSMGIGEDRGKNGILDEAAIIRENQFIKFVTASTVSQSYLFVASTKGIYFSFDQGKNWKRLPTVNLAVDNITAILVLEDSKLSQKNCSETSQECLKILVGTRKGAFFLSNGKWMPLYKGMETNQISYLAKSVRESVYAATTKGIYFLSVEKALPSLNRMAQTIDDLRDQVRFHNEPNINEVHQLAIDYAEVNREKIINWRSLARKKALLPDLSVGLDRDASDMFHWNTGANPDELQKGRDLIDWDVSLSWDLADFVWSTDQTTIDSRSKLMVELREDILDQVTRLYFERRRIQVEFLTDEFLSPQLTIDKEMRIAELTALIDALTGGEFSKRIVRK